MPKKKKKKKKFVLGELESDLHALQAQTEEHEHVEDTATVAPEVRPTPDTTEKAPVPDEDEGKFLEKRNVVLGPNRARV